MNNKITAAFSLVGLALLGSSCVTHVRTGYRAYDPAYSDYHVWGRRKLPITTNGRWKHIAHDETISG